MYIAIDIGGSNTRIGTLASLGAPEVTLIGKFPTQPDYEQQLRAIDETLQGYGAASFSGIGVSIGGRIAKDGRSVLVAPNLPAYVGKPFAQDMFERFSCPVRLAHDTVCGLLAEKRIGSIRDIDRCAYLTVSTALARPSNCGKARTP